MSVRIYYGTVSKRRNSTLQPTLTEYVDCVLKSPCSLTKPVFVVQMASFTANYLKWDNTYYFVSDVKSVANERWEIMAEIDVLATYKTEILANTCYVAYSSVSGGTWLPDTRIPVLRSTTASKNTAELDGINTAGTYVLSVVGQNGVVLYTPTLYQISLIMNSFDSKSVDEVYNRVISKGAFGKDVAENLTELAKCIVNSNVFGNAYSNAPECIRGCAWVPFSPDFAGGQISGPQEVYLGNFDTKISCQYINSYSPVIKTATVNIPWHFSDWRRGYCENVYLYLPLVGMVPLSADSITQVSTLTIKYSYTLTDGCISYEVYAGNEIIGTYGGNCAQSVPIGINQQAGAGEIVNSIVNGAEKTISQGLTGNIGGALGSVLNTGYDVLNTSLSSHISCVGGIGGGAGAGLDLTAACYTVAHDTVVEPSAMAVNMGVPTMKSIQLSSCSGYCQCVNARISCSAHTDELVQIDSMVNGGFYIE